ncbi:MAG: LysR family transcriptional regulator [Deltaproteobacteria bacterium]|jgi:DNA-binding transcriptional LysR family regulator|nr:LysR family transcriptional regulator [Deltaproteobacteria bacterium]
MKLAYLRTLVESIATGSFSKAAENLFITQSAVSRRIKFLEDQYGYPLVDRSGPVMIATEAGLVVIEKAEKILQIENDLLNDLRGLSLKTGITFCCTPSFGITYLPEIMKAFMLHKPDMLELKFSFEMPDKVVDGMLKGFYQVGVIEHNTDYDLADLETFELPGDEVVFVSSPQLGLTGAEVLIEDLIGFDLYTRNEGCCSSKLLDHNMKQLGRDCTDFNRIIYYDDLHLIISSVLQGYGLAFLSRSVIAKFVEEGTLRTHRATGFDHAYKRTLIVGNSSASTQLLGNLIEEIRGLFRKTPGEIDFSCCSPADIGPPFAP